MKKTTKKATTKKPRSRRPARHESQTTPDTTISAHESKPVQAVMITPVESAPVTSIKPRPMARTHRRLATPAQRRGADLVRFLRIHSKRPFATRGENAIVALAREVGHLGNLELNARD